MAPPTMTIAYLAPELPVLSATFVYEELLALERRGIRVMPFSVHEPGKPVAAQQALADRTRVLYRSSPLQVLGRGLFGFGVAGAKGWRALACLGSDMRQLGPWRPTAWKLAYQFMVGAGLARQLRADGCSHLHIHFAHVPTQIGMYAAAMAGIPFTVMAHANDIFERGQLLPEKAARAAKFLTISDHNIAYLRSVGVVEQHLAVVRCGVSFAPPAERPVVPHDKPRFRIGTLGRLVEKKGVDDLLRAVAQLQDASWQLELCIAGDGPLRNELEALARELGLADRVHFEGALPHAAVSAWLRSLDVFVLACKADARGDMDGIPVVLMEAMSQHVPVLSTRLSGIPELVIHGQTGWLAEPANPGHLAASLRKLLSDPLLRERLISQAAHHVEAEFGQAVNIDRLLGHIAASHVTAAVPLSTVPTVCP